ncbi:hypothetical protein Y032_0051g2087 [Ancylostoma ceylanicum]|uniref:Uncharacterized protein n=1 Tax=Ancylostoma ceylanicum TaxID=53326 RepID=A0A016U8P5_9BILA|nr:hypothetical protein Y032_0051g2087 [Ancylostoma ceylanicum]
MHVVTSESGFFPSLKKTYFSISSDNILKPKSSGRIPHLARYEYVFFRDHRKGSTMQIILHFHFIHISTIPLSSPRKCPFTHIKNQRFTVHYGRLIKSLPVRQSHQIDPKVMDGLEHFVGEQI